MKSLKTKTALFAIPFLTAATLVFGVALSTGPVAEAQKIAPALKFGDPLPANAFIELAKLINPAVINISTTTMPRGGPRGGRFNDPFMDMLEQMYGMRLQPRQQRPAQALGTGFIIREDGLAITNSHVINGADKIQVQFDEKNEKLIDAKLIGLDERTDIALIKIEGKGFPIIKMGSSASTEIGEWVAAFGNPLGVGHTMTKGIISAKGRDISEINRLPLLQTDTPINPGNSGGPLVNMKGEVIAVNSAIAQNAQGIGFAIPIDEVKAIIPDLEKSGKIKMGYLGIGLTDLDPQSAMELGLKEPEGALIMQVEPGMPAAKGGMKPYDVVTEFNGKKIRFSNELRDAVAGATIGKAVDVKVIREGKPKTLAITVAERPDPAKLAPRGLSKGSPSGVKAKNDLGFQMADINQAIRRDFKIEDDVNKPIVTAVERNSPAAKGGLLPGDIILDVNREEVKSVADVNRLIKKNTNTFKVFRQGTPLFLIVKN